MYSGQINSERELEAIRAELSSLRTRKNDLENELIEVMERREELEGIVSTLKERHAELTGKTPELAAARDEAATGIDAELADLKTRRQEQAGSLPDQLVGVYESMRERKSGVAVAELQGRTCSGCHLELTAIELEQAREDAAGGLAHCEQCERILVPAS